MSKKTKKPATKPAACPKAKPPQRLQPVRAAQPPAAPPPAYWRVVLTRVLHSGSSEAEARAAFSKFNRDLQHGDKLVMVENNK